MSKKKKEKVTEQYLFPEMANVGKKETVKKTRVTKSISKDVALLEEKCEKLQKQKEQLEQKIQSMMPKVEAYDALLASKSLFPTGVVAKSFGWSAVRLNKYLEQKKVQYFRSGIWMLYQKYAGKGYTGEQFYQYYEDNKGNKHTRAHTYWTMKGYEFIVKMLKDDNLI